MWTFGLIIFEVIKVFTFPGMWPHEISQFNVFVRWSLESAKLTPALQINMSSQAVVPLICMLCTPIEAPLNATLRYLFFFFLIYSVTTTNLQNAQIIKQKHNGKKIRNNTNKNICGIIMCLTWTALDNNKQIPLCLGFSISLPAGL